MSEEVKPLKMWKMVEPGLTDSPWQYARTHSFVSAAILGHQKNGHGPLPS